MPKISELTTITGAATASGDLFPVVDVSANETKQITRDELATVLSAPVLSYLGYNTAGGSNEVATANRVYMKKITAPSNGILLNVAAYLKNDTGDHVQQVGVAVFSDSAGSPLRILAANINPATSILLESASTTPVYRWLATPVNLDVAAGDYWIAVMVTNTTNPGSIAYDGSGTDRYYTSGGVWFTDAGFTTVTTGSNKYSIRAAFLPTA